MTNVPPGASVYWYYNVYNGVYPLSPSKYIGNPFTVRNVSETDDNVTLIAEIILSDSAIYKYKTLYLYNKDNPGAYIETDDYIDYSLREYDGWATDFQWEVSDGVVYMQGRSYTLIDLASGSGTYTVKCHYKNRCGQKITITKEIIQ